MSLSDQSPQIAARFKELRTAGNEIGVAVTLLAEQFKASEAAIRYHLKKANLIGDNAEEVAQSDAELGIDEEDATNGTAAEDAALEKLIADPKLSALIDRLVAQRIAQMGAVSVDTPPNGFKEFTESLKHMLEMQAIQQPGYVKPIPAEELDRRAAGYVEMKALIQHYETRPVREWPIYVLGDVFHGPSPNGPMLYPAGAEISICLPPAEHFQPQNDAARKVYDAMLQWIGGHTPEIGDQIVAAHAEANGRIVVTDIPQAPQSKVVMRDTPLKDVAKPHPFAHMLKETNGSPAPGPRPRAAGLPAQAATGPIFVTAEG